MSNNIPELKNNTVTVPSGTSAYPLTESDVVRVE